jgi:heme/copper-type cytochrome/quinol oxidase subunit 2
MTAILLPPAGWAGVAIVWGFMGTAVWILLIALIVLIVRAIRTTARDPQVPAERVLEEL